MKEMFKCCNNERMSSRLEIDPQSILEIRSTTPMTISHRFSNLFLLLSYLTHFTLGGMTKESYLFLDFKV